MPFRELFVQTRCVCVCVCLRLSGAQKSFSGCVFVCWLQSLMVFYWSGRAPHVFLDSVAPPPPFRVLCEVPHSAVMFDSGDLPSCGRLCLMSRPLPERRRRPSIRPHFPPSRHLHARVPTRAPASRLPLPCLSFFTDSSQFCCFRSPLF